MDVAVVGGGREMKGEERAAGSLGTKGVVGSLVGSEGTRNGHDDDVEKSRNTQISVVS